MPANDRNMPAGMTPDLLEQLRKLEEATPEEIDDPETARKLREGAEDHSKILRRSKELGCRRVYK